MAGEKLTRQNLVKAASPEMAPLLEAGFSFMERNTKPVIVMWRRNPMNGATATEFVSKAAKGLAASFWGSGAAPGGSHVEIAFKIFDSGVIEDMGYVRDQRTAGIDKAGWVRIKTTLARPPKEKSGSSKKPSRASRFDVVGGPI